MFGIMSFIKNEDFMKIVKILIAILVIVFIKKYNNIKNRGKVPYLNNTYREKLLNAVLFFVKNVRNPSKLKIYKLLYFFDFRHFKETGRNVTNLDYYALDFGPVPLDFYNETQDNLVPPDFSNYLVIDIFKSDESGKKGGLFKVKPKVQSNLEVFTPRERRILEEIAEIYRDVDASLISEISHFKNQPWDKTRKNLGVNKKIDYLLALDKESNISTEDAKEMMESRDEMLKNFPFKRT